MWAILWILVWILIATLAPGVGLFLIVLWMITRP